MGRRRLVVYIIALAALAVSPAAVAHTEHGEVDDRFLDRGTRLMVGAHDGPQAGPLAVAPWVDGPLPCASSDGSDFRLPLGDQAGVTIVGNATHIEAAFDVPAAGFVAFAVDTATASRTLLMMQEHAVARHRMLADLVPWPDVTPAPVSGIDGPRSGLVGLPYALEDGSQNSLGSTHGLEGNGIHIGYDDEAASWLTTCTGESPGHMALQMQRDALAESLAPGSVVHVVLLYDAALVDWLPRPLESTAVLQLNLYLARAGEEPEMLRATFANDTEATDRIPLLFILGGLGMIAGVGLRSRGRVRD